MGVQKTELGLPERVLVVLLVPPEVLGGFECGPSGAVAALVAARTGRHAAALCLHPGSHLRALLSSRFHRAGPSASRMLLPLPQPLLKPKQRLGSASHLKPPEAPGDREGALPAGGVTECDKAPSTVIEAEIHSWAPQFTKTRTRGTLLHQKPVPVSSLSSSLASFGCLQQKQGLLAALDAEKAAAVVVAASSVQRA